MNEYTDAAGIKAALNVLLRAAVQSNESRPEERSARQGHPLVSWHVRPGAGC